MKKLFEKVCVLKQGLKAENSHWWYSLIAITLLMLTAFLLIAHYLLE